MTVEESGWPRPHESGIEVVPAEWLGLASGNQDGEAFMRAFGRRRRGESDPRGVKCVLCGFPCESDQTICAVPREFASPGREAPLDGLAAAAHVACSHTMYRGRFDALKHWVEDGLSRDECLRRLALWPWNSEEEKADAEESARKFREYMEARDGS